MRISNFGMGVLHVLHVFCDVISLLALVFIVSSNRVSTQTDKQTHKQTDRPGENNTSQPPPGAR